jgi:hypothetical protein
VSLEPLRTIASALEPMNGWNVRQRVKQLSADDLRVGGWLDSF